MATLHADDQERLDEIDRVWLVAPGDRGAAGSPGREARLEGWKRRGHRVVLKLTGIESVEEARAVQGWEIRIDEADSPPRPPAGRWFAHQLEGLEVFDPSGRSLGRVARVISPGGQTLLAVEGGSGELLIPLVPAICVRIDPEAGRIEVDPPDGLLDLNAV